MRDTTRKRMFKTGTLARQSSDEDGEYIETVNEKFVTEVMMI